MAKDKKAKKSISSGRDEAKMNMTPMIDIVFQLIIFFMLVCEMSSVTTDADVTLPLADQAIEPQKEPNLIIVNVRSNGDITEQSGGSVLTIQALENRLKGSVAGEQPDEKGNYGLPVLIRADRLTKYYKVQLVMAACMKARLYKLYFGAYDEMPRE